VKYLVRIGWVILVGIGLMLGAGFYLSPQDKLRSSDAIVVISGGETAERVNEGVELYWAGWAPLLIMSGAARDEGPSNAAAMRKLAITAGVPADKIILDEEARDTISNAQNVRALIGDHGIGSIILVTSPYHQRRALVAFRHFLGSGFPIVNHSSTDSAWRKNGWWTNAWARHLTWTELTKVTYLSFAFPRT